MLRGAQRSLMVIGPSQNTRLACHRCWVIGSIAVGFCLLLVVKEVHDWVKPTLRSRFSIAADVLVTVILVAFFGYQAKIMTDMYAAQLCQLCP